MGCTVHALAGSVENEEDVGRVVVASGKPVKGVFQLAMVLEDKPLLDTKWSEWQAVVGPKVRNIWNLHRALENQSLDFFWLASSIITVVDQAGQGSYSDGCAFLEAFCQYRHSLNLPASVLNICPISGSEYVEENKAARKSLIAQSLYEWENASFSNLSVTILSP